MLIKMFGHGEGPGSGPVDYVLGAVEAGQGEVLRGDPARTVGLIDSLKWRGKRYTSGVVSFSRDENVDDYALNVIMHELKNFFDANDAVETDVLFVKHVDKGRTELHFIVPHVDLRTMRQYTPYLDRFDRKTLNALRDWLVADLGLVNPDRRRKAVGDPDYIRSTEKRSEFVKLVGEVIEGVARKWLRDQVAFTRKHALNALKMMGIEVVREGKNYVTVVNPATGKKVRLKGKVFEEGGVITRKDLYRADPAEDPNEKLKEFTDLFRKRVQRISERYKSPVPEIEDPEPAPPRAPRRDRSVSGPDL